MSIETRSERMEVDGITVHVEGRGPGTILMLHGWPDTLHLWDATVQVLKDEHRCVRCTLPGFDVAQAPRALSLQDMTAWLLKVVDAVSPDAPVTLLLHDWGCMFGYELAARHPQRVARVMGLDVGDFNAPAFARSLSGRAKAGIFAYQFWLAVAYKVGGPVGSWMTRWMARALRCPSDLQRMGWQMNYPYAMQWFGTAGGLRHATRFEPACPMLYLYGRRKPFMFHSPQWLERLAQGPNNRVEALRAGHWLMVDQPEAFHDCIQSWLRDTA